MPKLGHRPEGQPRSTRNENPSRSYADPPGLLNVVPNSNPLGIRPFVPGSFLSFKYERQDYRRLSANLRLKYLGGRTKHMRTLDGKITSVFVDFILL